MIQKGHPLNRLQKVLSRQISLAVNCPPATPEYLNWSHQHVGFDREDHPPQVPRPEHSALVFEGQVGGYTMSKIFIDGGSGLNLIYANTLRAISFPLINVQPTESSFYGIVPGKPNIPMDK